MHFSCAALEGNLAFVGREPEHHDPLYRLAYFAELLPGPVPPGQLCGLARGGIKQQSCGRRGNTEIALSGPVGRVRNFSGLSGDAKCLWIKALRDQGSTAHPQEIPVSVGSWSIDHSAFRRYDLDPVRRFVERSDISSAVFRFSGFHTE